MIACTSRPSTEREASRAKIDPAAQLAAAVVRQAVLDYFSDDPVMSLDALLWFLDPAGAAVWLAALNLDDDESLIFRRLAHGERQRAFKFGEV